jgi:hypothetical protein
MIFYWGLLVLPKPKVPVLRCWKPTLLPTFICCTTHCALLLDHHEEVESLGLLAEPAGWIHRKIFWYLTGNAYWHQHAPPEPYQPSVQ